ncbi:MAG: hypothetical protein A2Y97_07430 [Nitrospirae bacterium RBG_13_39_12]|nr:MAG: hypothetical protein A2Y97_07430 [Nitrospirae bacterium RBG_13_39_12]
MHISIRATFKRRFLAGLLISIPAIVTLLMIGWFFRFVDGLLEPLYYNILGYHVRGIGFISAIVIIFIIGIISTNVFGRRIIGYLEMVMLRIPVFKGIYTAIKQLVDAFSPDVKGSSFKKFVVVEYPKSDVFAFGFLTKECVVKKGSDGKESCLKAVYIPTNNLYLGEIALFRDENVFYTDITIDEGIKIILSGGIATPSNLSEVKK